MPAKRSNRACRPGRLWYVHPPVSPVRSRSRARVVLAAALCAAAFVSPGTTDESDGLATRRANLVSAEREALLRLYAAETAVDRARKQVAGLGAAVERLAREVRASRRYRSIATTSLAASRARVSNTLRRLYIDGPPPDAIAVLLGAQSFDEAVDGMDTLRLVADQNRSLAQRAEARAAALQAAVVRLERRSTALEAARRDATASVASLQAIVADRTRYVASLREERRLTDARLRRLAAEARAAAARSRAITAEAATAPPAPDPTPPGRTTSAEEGTTVSDPPPDPGPAAREPEPSPKPAPRAPDGSRTITVSATAYSLSGTTASGLPVGPGIIAVDPSVIPLGTRVFVPGYGEAVAADTGSAVQGNIIDVWLPSYADAVAWGRKSLTITVYRS